MLRVGLLFPCWFSPRLGLPPAPHTHARWLQIAIVRVNLKLCTFFPHLIARLTLTLCHKSLALLVSSSRCCCCCCLCLRGPFFRFHQLLLISKRNKSLLSDFCVCFSSKHIMTNVPPHDQSREWVRRRQKNVKGKLVFLTCELKTKCYQKLDHDGLKCPSPTETYTAGFRKSNGISKRNKSIP